MCSPRGEAGDCDFPTGVYACIQISHLLVSINSAVNCVFYYISGQQFRQLGRCVKIFYHI